MQHARGRIRVDSACRRSGPADGKQSLPLFPIIADRGIEGDDAPRIEREYLYAMSLLNNTEVYKNAP